MREGARDRQHAERHDEGRHADIGDEEAIDGAAHEARCQASGKGDVPGIFPGQEQAGDDTATRPMIEPTDRSMPPVMITTIMPSAMMPNGAKLRVMLAKFSAVQKARLEDAHARRPATSSATITQKGWLADMRCRRSAP